MFVTIAGRVTRARARNSPLNQFRDRYRRLGSGGPGILATVPGLPLTGAG